MTTAAAGNAVRLGVVAVLALLLGCSGGDDDAGSASSSTRRSPSTTTSSSDTSTSTSSTSTSTSTSSSVPASTSSTSTTSTTGSTTTTSAPAGSTTTTASTAPPATTTSTAPAPGPSTTIVVTVGAPTAEAAATVLYDAWVAGDPAAAARTAEPAAVDALFLQPAISLRFLGCFADGDTQACQYSSNELQLTFRVQGTGRAYRVVEVVAASD